MENGASLFVYVDVSTTTSLSSPTPNCLALDYLSRARLRVQKKSALQGSVVSIRAFRHSPTNNNYCATARQNDDRHNANCRDWYI